MEIKTCPRCGSNFFVARFACFGMDASMVETVKAISWDNVLVVRIQ